MQDITKVVQNVMRRAELRDQLRKKEQEAGSRDKIIDDAFPVIIHDFFCEECLRDYASRAKKIVEDDWTLAGQRIAYYVSKCPEGHVNKRRIVDKHKDPYFMKSLLIKQQRINHKKDILQSFDSGFNMLYGNKNPYSGGE